MNHPANFLLACLIAVAALNPAGPCSVFPPAAPHSRIYLYAHANPVNGVDPSGHFTVSEINVTSAIQTTLQTIRAQGARAVLRKMRARLVMVYLGIGKGVTSDTFGHAFIYVEFLRLKTGGLYYDANPSAAGWRRIVRAGGANLRGLFGAGSVPGIVIPTPMSKAEALQSGRLIPVARLGTLGFLSWSAWIRGIEGDLSYKFFALPGGSSVSCYTWAAESAAKAFALGLLPF